MLKLVGRLALAAVALAAVACAKQTSTTATSTQTTATQTAAAGATAVPAASKTPVVLAITERAITTAGKPILRLAFTIHNGSKDPVLCDASVFSVQLSDKSAITADSAAEYKCEPDTVDPSADGKALMYFDLPGPYSGQVTLVMTASDAVVGQVTTNIQ